METQQCFLFSIVEMKTFRDVYTSFGCPNSLLPFHSKRTLLWPFKVAGNSNTLRSASKVPDIFVSYFNKIWTFMTDFRKSPQY